MKCWWRAHGIKHTWPLQKNTSPNMTSLATTWSCPEATVTSNALVDDEGYSWISQFPLSSAVVDRLAPYADALGLKVTCHTKRNSNSNSSSNNNNSTKRQQK